MKPSGTLTIQYKHQEISESVTLDGAGEAY